ncbi:putative C9orf72-like protein family [Monocercomonoides exilis]|uniref:putative C9orf72-like protein family n=1 Tax=Monocercomonoides exilis TaxID=2049356 RepID=UPI00355AA420|nr:putative C9orf72-like protein family [Monocercomonoides exilis]|eukprot:MONOS_7736.1-p1 / transcript=MONOS_7736.1 / gene=MONOS_7736 / organism=Monocercomonoides_exilis_PA203 / gene_product=unspecified product / transcript_product=unspecified product / location=Mono_scaffold00272:47736-52915(+) / protein_length=1472 / sequence_SO=supercontig / SO=protein_coding / is_pseudo=false
MHCQRTKASTSCSPPFHSIFCHGVILSHWHNIFGPQIMKYWRGDYVIPDDELECLARNVLDTLLGKTSTSRNRKPIEIKMNILQDPDYVLLSALFCSIQEGTESRFALTFVFCRQTIQRIQQVMTVLSDRIDILGLRLRNILDTFPDSLECFSRILPEEIAEIDALFLSGVAQPPIANSFLYCTPAYLKDGNHFLENAIQAHLQSGCHSVVVGEMTASINKMVNTLLLFSPPSFCFLSRLPLSPLDMNASLLLLDELSNNSDLLKNSERLAAASAASPSNPSPSSPSKLSSSPAFPSTHPRSALISPPSPSLSSPSSSSSSLSPSPSALFLTSPAFSSNAPVSASSPTANAALTNVSCPQSTFGSSNSNEQNNKSSSSSSSSYSSSSSSSSLVSSSFHLTLPSPLSISTTSTLQPAPHTLSSASSVASYTSTTSTTSTTSDTSISSASSISSITSDSTNNFESSNSFEDNKDDKQPETMLQSADLLTKMQMEGSSSALSMESNDNDSDNDNRNSVSHSYQIIKGQPQTESTSSLEIPSSLSPSSPALNFSSSALLPSSYLQHCQSDSKNQQSSESTVNSEQSSAFPSQKLLSPTPPPSSLTVVNSNELINLLPISYASSHNTSTEHSPSTASSPMQPARPSLSSPTYSTAMTRTNSLPSSSPASSVSPSPFSASRCAPPPPSLSPSPAFSFTRTASLSCSPSPTLSPSPSLSASPSSLRLPPSPLFSASSTPPPPAPVSVVSSFICADGSERRIGMASLQMTRELPEVKMKRKEDEMMEKKEEEEEEEEEERKLSSNEFECDESGEKIEEGDGRKREDASKEMDAQRMTNDKCDGYEILSLRNKTETSEAEYDSSQICHPKMKTIRLSKQNLTREEQIEQHRKRIMEGITTFSTHNLQSVLEEEELLAKRKELSQKEAEAARKGIELNRDQFGRTERDLFFDEDEDDEEVLSVICPKHTANKSDSVHVNVSEQPSSSMFDAAVPLTLQRSISSHMIASPSCSLLSSASVVGLASSSSCSSSSSSSCIAASSISTPSPTSPPSSLSYPITALADFIPGLAVQGILECDAPSMETLLKSPFPVAYINVSKKEVQCFSSISSFYTLRQTYLQRLFVEDEKMCAQFIANRMKPTFALSDGLSPSSSPSGTLRSANHTTALASPAATPSHRRISFSKSDANSNRNSIFSSTATPTASPLSSAYSTPCSSTAALPVLTPASSANFSPSLSYSRNPSSLQSSSSSIPSSAASYPSSHSLPPSVAAALSRQPPSFPRSIAAPIKYISPLLRAVIKRCVNTPHSLLRASVLSHEMMMLYERALFFVAMYQQIEEMNDEKKKLFGSVKVSSASSSSPSPSSPTPSLFSQMSSRNTSSLDSPNKSWLFGSSDKKQSSSGGADSKSQEQEEKPEKDKKAKHMESKALKSNVNSLAVLKELMGLEVSDIMLLIGVGEVLSPKFSSGISDSSLTSLQLIDGLKMFL